MPSESYILQAVASLKPGQQITIGFREVEDAFPAQPPWTPPERLLENIVGSSYEFSFSINPMNREVTFSRREKPLTEDGLLTYVSADRKQYYNFNGSYYRRNNKPYVKE